MNLDVLLKDVLANVINIYDQLPLFTKEVLAKYQEMSANELKKTLISELNYEIRNRYKSCELVGFKVKPGDVCFIDFGKAYINEVGYQHLGIVISIFNSKALVIPMSSNLNMYHQSYCKETYPHGKRHLMRLPENTPGINTKSVLFLNDMKYINTARIIDVKGTVDSDQLKKIKQRVKERMEVDE